MKHIGIKIMIQTYTVKMCDFFNFFLSIQMNQFCVGKNFVHASSTECQKPRSNKNCILQILFSQNRN